MQNNNKTSTYFSVNGEGISVEGMGQETIAAARKYGKTNHPGYPVVLKGFKINDKDIKVDLRVTPKNVNIRPKHKR